MFRSIVVVILSLFLAVFVLLGRGHTLAAPVGPSEVAVALVPPAQPPATVGVAFEGLRQATADALYHLGELTVLVLVSLPLSVLGLTTLCLVILAGVGAATLLGAWKKQ